MPPKWDDTPYGERMRNKYLWRRWKPWLWLGGGILACVACYIEMGDLWSIWTR